MTDRLYNDIVTALEALNDGNKFQSCACDLLRKDYPRLVPISGGGDAGSDGRAHQTDGQIIQLISTTQDSVISNLDGSLEEAKRKSQESHGVLLATSRRLSPVQKRNLTERTAAFGKTLLGIYDQEAFVNLLYHDAHWRMELLGLAGTPPALSSVPVNLRTASDLVLVGRDTELAEVVKTERDLVVAGQPGSGKTHLLAAAAKQAGGLFLVRDDPTEIANDLRRMQPTRVIVDDAFSRLDLLKSLCQTRRSLSLKFHIVASCWPDQDAAIAALLDVTGAPVVRLEPLLPKTIKEIINAMQIAGPDHVVAEIIHQAAGKPGLAVTLCRLCWRNGTQALFSGEALARDVRLSVEAPAGVGAAEMLAHFALAGKSGLTVDAVALATGVPGIHVRRQAEVMSMAGVLEVAEESRLTVTPARLGQALVRDVFGRPPALDWTKLITVVPSREDLLETVIAAGLLGGRIDPAKLQTLVAEVSTGSSREGELVELYARLGAAESRWVLTHRPMMLQRAAEPLLEHIPDEAIPALLREEMAETGPLPSRREALKELRKWIDDMGDREESIPRRGKLLCHLEKIAGEVGAPRVLLGGAGHVLATGFEWHRSVPGDPYQFSLVNGVISPAMAEAIARFWPRVRTLLTGLPRAEALRLGEIVRDWVHPGSGMVKTSDELKAACRRQAAIMFDELVARYAAQWTVVRKFEFLADDLGRKLPASGTLADRLFPPDRRHYEPGAVALSEAEARQLTAEWLARGPAPELITEWVGTDRDACRDGVAHTNLSRTVANLVAEQTPDPGRWLTPLIAAGANVYVVEPFLERCCAESDEVRRAFVGSHPPDSPYRILAVEHLVRGIPADDALWQGHTPLPNEILGPIENLVARDLVPEPTLAALMSRHGAVIARGVATQLWTAEPEGEIPPALWAGWKEAIITHARDDHELPDIARRHPEIAAAWIKRRLNLSWQERYHEGHVDSFHCFPGMMAALPLAVRRDLIDHFAMDNHQGGVLDALVGADLDLFRHALNRPETRKLLLSCLGLPGNPLTYWSERALLLLDAGFTENDVLRASDLIGGGWTGPTSRHHDERRKSFLPLLEHPDARIQRIGRAADEYLKTTADRERIEERRKAVKGEIG